MLVWLNSKKMVLSIKQLKDIANILRHDALQMTTSAGSGHPTSCLSCAEIMSVLFFNEMSYDIFNAESPDNDEFILSKGHAAPIYYAALKRSECINNDLFSLRQFGSVLEGHPMPSPEMPWVKVATGSLGQGLSTGIGMALAARLQKRLFRTYVLLGDSECAEGSVWEAAQLASYYKLNNLCAIVDINSLGQRGETMLAHDRGSYKKRFESFGWQAIAIEGHSIKQIINSFQKAKKTNKPSIILAKTIKGKGVSFLEGKQGWHGRALNEDELKKALKEIPDATLPKLTIKKPIVSNHVLSDYDKTAINAYVQNEMVSTREAYGNALAKLAEHNSGIIALDAEVSNSTFAGKVKERAPSQFVECFIAEQNMISMALGLSKKGFKPFASSFASFLVRAHDQLRMAALSQPNIAVCGSHAGVSIGEDGASQMGLEDIALFRNLPNSIIFYPSDAVSTEKLVRLAAEIKGLVYIRTTRPKTPIIYNSKDDFMVHNFKVLRLSNNDSAILVGAGITLHEALKAHDLLKKQGISTAVIDCYCIKPFPANKFIEFAAKHGNKVIIAEDHYSEGGIGEMLMSACSSTSIIFKHLAVRAIPHSGTKEQLLDNCGIGAQAIIKATRVIVK